MRSSQRVAVRPIARALCSENAEVFPVYIGEAKRPFSADQRETQFFFQTQPALPIIGRAGLRSVLVYGSQASMIWLAHLIILFSRLFDLLGAGPVREIIRGVGLDLKILAHDKSGGFALGLFSLAGHVEAAFM